MKNGRAVMPEDLKWSQENGQEVAKYDGYEITLLKDEDPDEVVYQVSVPDDYSVKLTRAQFIDFLNI